MKQRSSHLGPELERHLKLEASLQGTSKAEIIREALRRYFETRPSGLPPGAGKFDSGFADTAERADAILVETGFGKVNE